MDSNASNKALEYIQDFLIKLAEGNFDASLNINDENDEQLAGLQVGINMLVEELQSTTISREYLKNIYNGINEILIVLNDKGEIQEINEIGANKLLYIERELIGQSIEKIIHIDSIENIRSTLKNILKSKQSDETGLNFVSKNSHTIIRTSCSFSYLFNNIQKSGSILMLAKDISVLLDAKQQLEHKSDELNLFVYKASHDLKSPVANMLGLMNLARNSDNSTELKQYLTLFNKSTKKLEAILNELLIIGQVTYGKLDIKPVNVNEILSSLIEEFQLNEKFKKISLHLETDKNIGTINTEANLFRTILFNLIDNAIKYTKTNISDSYIKVNIGLHEKGILITIEDNGIGIEEHLQKDVFKMFYRATYASTGSGLGLYIVNISVQKLEGTITLESQPNIGSTFNVYIPSL